MYMYSTWMMTSTWYLFPLLCWKPLNRLPLWKGEQGKPNCLPTPKGFSSSVTRAGSTSIFFKRPKIAGLPQRSAERAIRRYKWAWSSRPHDFTCYKKMLSLCCRNGFFLTKSSSPPSSINVPELLETVTGYGPLGAALRRNLINEW